MPGFEDDKQFVVWSEGLTTKEALRLRNLGIGILEHPTAWDQPSQLTFPEWDKDEQLKFPATVLEEPIIVRGKID